MVAISRMKLMNLLKKNAVPIFVVLVAVTLVLYMNYRPEGFYGLTENQRKQCMDRHQKDKRYSWNSKKLICVGPVKNASEKNRIFPGCPEGYEYHNFNEDCRKKDGSHTIRRDKVKWDNRTSSYNFK